MRKTCLDDSSEDNLDDSSEDNLDDSSKNKLENLAENYLDKPKDGYEGYNEGDGLDDVDVASEKRNTSE